MNKKIKVLITTAVVLFLGLGIYTFASPNDEEDLFSETSKQNIQKVENVPTKKVDPVVEEQEVIEDEHDEQVLNVPEQNRQVQAGRVQQRQDNVQNQNPVEEEVVVEVQDEAQDAYDAAEELVAKAESTLLNTDLTAARNAVNNVVDIDITILATRLDKVSNDINTRTLVENLENLVKEAASKDDITTANTYNLTEEVETKVEAVNNATLKEELTSTMTELKKVLNDTTKPLVVNIVDKLNTNQDVTINVTDDTKVIIKLDNVVIENGKKVDAEGTYTLTVIDEAFNEDTITFTIDKTAPTVDVDAERYYNSSLTAVITDTNFDKATLNEVEYTTQKIGVTADGEYTLVMYDKAGNTSTVKFYVDKTAPVIKPISTSVGSNNIYSVIDLQFSDNTKIVKTVTNGKEVKRTPDKGMSQYFISYGSLYKEGENTVELYDVAGNKTTYTFTLDTTPAKITKSLVYAAANGAKTTDAGYANKGNIHVRFAVDSTLLENPIVKVGDKEVKATLVGENYYDATFTIASLADGKFEFTITNVKDLAGNVTNDVTKTTNNSWIIVDKTAPVIEGINTNLTNQDVTLTITDTNLANVTVNGTEVTLEENKITFNEDNTYVVVATDLVGNTTTKEFRIDKTVPQIKAANIYVAGDPNEQSTFYAKVGDKIVAYVRLTEELQTPVFELVSGNTTISMGEVSVSGPNASGEYTYQAIYTVNDGDLPDGEVTLKVSNVKDLANNGIDNITNPTNGHKVIIDRESPTPIVSYSTTNITNQNVTVTLTSASNEELQAIAGWNTEDNKVFTKEIEKNVETTKVTIKDLAGNESTTEYVVANIDKDKPVVTAVASNYDAVNNKFTRTNQNVTVTLTSTLNEELQAIEGWNTENNIVFTKEFDKNVKDKIVVKDIAGNEVEVEYEVDEIDKVKPKLEKIEYSEPTDNGVIVTITTNEALKQPGNGWVMNGKARVYSKVYTDNTKETLTVQDLYGNPLDIQIEVDSIVISFKLIDREGKETSYTAEKGMTWETWVSSEYNTSLTNNIFDNLDDYLEWYKKTAPSNYEYGFAFDALDHPTIAELKTKNVTKAIIPGALWLADDILCYSGTSLYSGSTRIAGEKYIEYGLNNCGHYYFEDESSVKQYKDAVIKDKMTYFQVDDN